MKIDLENNEYFKKYKEKYQDSIKSEPVQNYLNMTLTIASIAVFIGFAIRPSLVTILKLRNEINEYSVIDEKLSEKIINLSTANTLQEEHAEEIALLDKAIPAKSEESKVLKILNYLAIKNNLAFSSINNTFSTNSKYQKVNMTIELNGTYDSVLTFLTDVKEVLRIIDIDEIKMNLVKKDEILQKADQKDNVRLLDVTIKASAFFELDKNESKPANALDNKNTVPVDNISN